MGVDDCSKENIPPSSGYQAAECRKSEDHSLGLLERILKSHRGKNSSVCSNNLRFGRPKNYETGATLLWISSAYNYFGYVHVMLSVCVAIFKQIIFSSRFGARFSAPVQAGPEAHPANCTMDVGSFPVVKRLGRGVNHPPSYSAEVKGRVQLYFHSLSGPSVACSRVNCTFALIYV